MTDSCCNLVGGFSLATSGCIISVNNVINTELTDLGCGGALTSGPRIGTLNISGYAGAGAHKGCPGRAGVQVLWLRKFRCDTGQTHFIFLGTGRSFAQGGGSAYVSLGSTASMSTSIVTASSQSGSGALYTSTDQIEGLGMSYSNGPITFSTDNELGVTLSNLGFGSGPCYLQNFNIELVPGSIPVASYTFAYNA